MLKPDSFRQPCVAMQNLPYTFAGDSAGESAHSGGVLGRGQTVWTRERYELKRCPRSATAFVEGLGIVSVDPLWLVTADILTPAQEENAVAAG